LQHYSEPDVAPTTFNPVHPEHLCEPVLPAADALPFTATMLDGVGAGVDWDCGPLSRARV
jgi:hypothetical protein